MFLLIANAVLMTALALAFWIAGADVAVFMLWAAGFSSGMACAAGINRIQAA